ncbi:hypothetical protein BWQ96_09671 [Gracilariopsis chorda]|uniref:Uncharacterized protein n=1 Tax=Gracilariopsis chorda TaxID=448386 RepID=A0A2V3IHK5_9FLOR|nr:hypothetical protein BWQ96_09671 [Gracilariopsis chorda]|eukprot:PXF40620.1 hypothetical protein BWQ96_09671 [Gracilariopsis chorda]
MPDGSKISSERYEYENSNGGEELQMDDYEAHLFESVEELSDNEFLSTTDIATDIAVESPKEQFFQQAEVSAALNTLIKALQANVLGQEVLKQIKFIREGFRYKVSVRNSGYHGRRETQANGDYQRVLTRAF